MSLVNFNKILTWADFPNSLPEPKPADFTVDSAVIKATWEHNIKEYVVVGKAIKVGPYSVTIFLTPNSGAVVQSILTKKAVADALLKHEQGHYDIVAIAAREYHNRLATLESATLEELKETIKKLFKEMSEKSDNTDATYDVRTKHSLDKDQQDVWNKAITTQKRDINGSVDNLPS